MSLLVKNGRVVTEEGIKELDILLEEGKIKKLGKNLNEGAEVIDCQGKYVLPGLIDAHTHFYMLCGPDEHTIDDFYSGSVSALFGGITTIIDYIEPEPGQNPLSAYKQRRQEADGFAALDYGLHFVASRWDDEYRRELEQVFQKGVTSLKVFTAYDDLLLPYEKINDVLIWARENNVLVTFHAEEEEVVLRAQERLKDEKKTGPEWHGESRPVESEVEAIERLMEIGYKVDVPIYIAHVSSARAAEKIQAAQKRGQKVIAETCPHYLFLNSSLYQESENPQLYIMCPPLREKKEQADMWQFLKNGLFSVIASDHCTFSRQQKLRSRTYYDTLPGIPGVETLLPLMYSAVAQGIISLEDLVRLQATNPARIHGLYPEKGVVREGSHGDLVIFNPKHRVKLTKDVLHSRAGYTPFDLEVPGYPEITIRQGRIVCQDGSFYGQKGEGRFLPREQSQSFSGGEK